MAMPKQRTDIRDTKDSGQITLLNGLVLAGLLALPVIALHRQAINLLWAGAYVFVLGAITYGIYAMDKRRAQTQAWRVPEAHLHLLELLGGWPGAYLAQRRLRHKCSKIGYQFIFWLIVLAYQLVAFDSLQNWRFFHMIRQAIR